MEEDLDTVIDEETSKIKAKSAFEEIEVFIGAVAISLLIGIALGIMIGGILFR